MSFAEIARVVLENQQYYIIWKCDGSNENLIVKPIVIVTQQECNQ